MSEYLKDEIRVTKKGKLNTRKSNNKTTLEDKCTLKDVSLVHRVQKLEVNNKNLNKKDQIMTNDSTKTLEFKDKQITLGHEIISQDKISGVNYTNVCTDLNDAEKSQNIFEKAIDFLIDIIAFKDTETFWGLVKTSITYMLLMLIVSFTIVNIAGIKDIADKEDNTKLFNNHSIMRGK